jgi:hypothetical protein
MAKKKEPPLDRRIISKALQENPDWVVGTKLHGYVEVMPRRASSGDTTFLSAVRARVVELGYDPTTEIPSSDSRMTLPASVWDLARADRTAKMVDAVAALNGGLGQASAGRRALAAITFALAACPSRRHDSGVVRWVTDYAAM